MLSVAGRPRSREISRDVGQSRCDMFGNKFVEIHFNPLLNSNLKAHEKNENSTTSVR